jgi:hypothetical protein
MAAQYSKWILFSYFLVFIALTRGEIGIAGSGSRSGFVEPFLAMASASVLP